MAVQALRDGKLLAFPTDTVYGLGCSVNEKKAIERLYQLKRVDRGHPMALLCADLKSVPPYGHVSNPAYKILRRLLPGPYTFVLPATHQVPKMMLMKQHTVGIRVPDNQVIRDLITELGLPILSTSAELPDHELFLSAEDLEEALGKQLAFVIDGGLLPDERSTVIDLTSDEPILIRQGKGVYEV